MEGKTCWYLTMALKYIMVLLIASVLVVVGERIGYIHASRDFELKAAEEEQLRYMESARAVESDPYVVQLNSEAELLARVLYGVKDNDTDDLRTYCWCVFNRVDNPNFPNTIEDVISQPNQWMRYNPDNPIVEDLYRIAKEELDKWHTDSHRPVSCDYVFMSWSHDDICLRDNFNNGKTTRYWRYGN